jgi:hypothetical protein
LCPTIRSPAKYPWEKEEDDLILSQFTNIGASWSIISKYLIGRTPNAIKNHWNSSLKYKLDH